MVEHSSHNPMIKYVSPATGMGRQKMMKKTLIVVFVISRQHSGRKTDQNSIIKGLNGEKKS